jgi:hypothetical protein
MFLSLREKRALNALKIRPIMREELDEIAGCSNGPELVAGLRRKGLEVPCERITRIDRDGKQCRPGRYELTQDDKKIIREWFRGGQG